MASKRAMRAAVVVALGLVLLSCSRHARAKTARAGSKVAVGQVAPELVGTDLDGRRVDLKALRGKVVLVNFWATWCGPCKMELPKFATWQRKYGAEGLRVIAVSMNDSEAPVRRYVRRLRPGFPVVMGDAQLGRAYGGVLGLPVTFLIGRDGRIVSRTEGGADLPVIEAEVKELLAKR